MIQRAAAAVLLCVMFGANGAAAHSMRCDKPTTPTTQPPSLQQILDGLVVSGPAIDASAPLDLELWTNSAGPMTAQVVADYAKQSIFFGMYDPDNAGNLAFLLPDGIKASDIATVAFNDNQSITVSGPISKSYSPFEGPFGFFIQEFDQRNACKCNGWDKHKGWGWGWGKHHGVGGAKQVFYTQDALNPSGAPRAIVFQGNGQTVIKLPGMSPGVFLPSQFLIAWETGLGDANDGKFNDFLVFVSGIVPATVPEPAFAFLLGISSLALLCGRRARSALK